MKKESVIGQMNQGLFQNADLEDQELFQNADLEDPELLQNADQGLRGGECKTKG